MTMIFGKEAGDGFERYREFLELFSSLSYVFGDSGVPFLHYRIMENVFCKAFSAENLSRTDTAFDASKTIDGRSYGVGLKTFSIGRLREEATKSEKVAEFNHASALFLGKSRIEIALLCADLRNARILAAQEEYGLGDRLYHCVARAGDGTIDGGRLLVGEHPYDEIDPAAIIIADKSFKPLPPSRWTETTDDNVYFIAGDGQYSFNRSKSTLYRRFVVRTADSQIIPVSPVADPYESLMAWFSNVGKEQKKKPGLDYVVLPLFSTRGGGKNVPERSGLNQWNANGRKRNAGEMYIPIPSVIRQKCQGFFPPRGEQFALEAPNGTRLRAAACQAEGKALMSDPNSALSEWFHPLLARRERDVPISYADLERIGKDSVLIEKKGPGLYSFSLAAIGSWESFNDDLEKNEKMAELIE